MTRFDFGIIAALVAIFALIGAIDQRRPNPATLESSYVPMPPRTTFPQPEHNTGGVNVLTAPRYQDVPALNRPMMLPTDCYSDNGCSK